MIKQFICYLSTWSKHSISKVNHDGDVYCKYCNEYLYTEYDFKASLKKMRNDAKMWWETPE